MWHRLRLIMAMLPVACVWGADDAAQLTLNAQFEVTSERPQAARHDIGNHVAHVARLPLIEARDWHGQFVRVPERSEKAGFPKSVALSCELQLLSTTRSEPTPFENVSSANFVVTFPEDAAVTLHWNKGSHAETSDFRPLSEVLQPTVIKQLESFGGRSSDGALPYFNLVTNGGGLIVAIGWPGDWQVTFHSPGGGRVHVVAGLKRCRFRLDPGERVRMPSVLLVPYRGDRIDGQNQFRRLMLRHFTPLSIAPKDLMPVAASVHGMLAFNDTTESSLTQLANDIGQLHLPLDTFWLDAGWNEGGFPGSQGNPHADPTRFPHGLKPVGDAARAAGLRFLAWFEPERVMRGTWLHREHPDWLLLPTQTPEALRYQETDGFHLLDFGNRAAREWAIEAVSKEITASGIDVYRQDFNAYPSYFWHTREPDDELGLREVRYINGLYEFLDELRRRHPKLIIDNCASGGRRVDYETLRRSVVLWRSDSCWDQPTYPRNVQAMTHGLSHWLPLHGLGSVATDDVSLRSGMGACGSFAINYRDPNAVAALRRHLDKYLAVRHLFATDYYPLTDWTDDPRQWLAFQFHDPLTGAGIVQAFCGPDPESRAITLRLRGLDPDEQYDITNWDLPQCLSATGGRELMEAGVSVSAAATSGTAVVLHYSIHP